MPLPVDVVPAEAVGYEVALLPGRPQVGYVEDHAHGSISEDLRIIQSSSLKRS